MSYDLSPRERFIAALERRPIAGRVPHFELVFFLTMEAFGKLHPQQRHFGQWGQMSRKEQDLHLDDIARLYIQIAEHYQHDAIFVQPLPDDSGWPGKPDGMIRLLNRIRELSGDKYYLMIHGDCTISIPGGDKMEELSCRMGRRR